MATHIPRDIIRVVWDFAWRTGNLCEPMCDLAYIDRIQYCIPPILFEERVALKSQVCRHWVEPNEMVFRSVFPPSPFIRGNPYIPTETLARQCLFNRNLELLTGMFTRSLIRHLRTYRGIVLRYVNKTLMTLNQWNALFLRFLRHPEVWNPDNYMYFSCVERAFVVEWCNQLKTASLI